MLFGINGEAAEWKVSINQPLGMNFAKIFERMAVTEIGSNFTFMGKSSYRCQFVLKFEESPVVSKDWH